MSKPLGFEKPLGMRDLLPAVLRKQRLIEEKLRNCIEKWGYSEIMTPTLEYYDTVGGASVTLDAKLFKLLDREGKTVVLRPDMTAPIARVASSLLQHEPLPLKLYYHANVFRTQEREAGRNAEFYQTGVELIGESDVAADAEVIALTVASLQSVEVSDFQIAVGHIGFLDGLLEEIVPGENDRAVLKGHLAAHDYAGFREKVSALPLSIGEKQRLHGILQLRGGAEQLVNAMALTTNGRAKRAVENLQELCKALEVYDVMDHVIFDFNLVSDLDYYTGILFEGYAAQQGFPVCSGGRYDSLLGQFGRQAPATGFALKLDRLVQSSRMHAERKGENVLILFTPEQRLDAIQLASQWRKKAGIAAVTTHLLDDWDEYSGVTADGGHPDGGKNSGQSGELIGIDRIIRLDGGTVK